MIDEISKKIRKLRKHRDYTLKDLSEKTDLSISFLSQVERGNSTLAITSLKKIATALEVPITEFFKSETKSRYLIKEKDQRKFKMEGCESVMAQLSGAFPNRDLEAMIVKIPPNSNHGHEFSHVGEEFVYILEGELTVTIDKTKYNLEKNDSIHYPSTNKHLWTNNSSSYTSVLCINTPNIFD